MNACCDHCGSVRCTCPQRWIKPEVDDAIYEALLNAVGCQLAFEATEAVVNILLARRDALADMTLTDA